MKKKWWIVIAVLFALAVGLAIVLPALLPPTPGVTYANFSRLDNGMTREQVEALLGKPNLDAGEVGIFFIPRDVAGDSTSYWRGDGGDMLMIRFDGNDCVFDIYWNGWPDGRSGLEKLRDRFPWLAKEPPSPSRTWKVTLDVR